MQPLDRDTPADGQSATDTKWETLESAAQGFARMWCRRSQDAQDVAHEALTELLTTRRRVEKPIAWLFVVTRRIAGRQLRRETRRVEAENNWCAASAHVRRVDRKSIVRLSQQISLTPRQRRLLTYRAVGYTDAEVAKRLGCSPGSVATLVARAVSKLKQTRSFD